MAGERVLVTGASGFIGLHIARRLAAAGYEVAGTVRSAERRVPAEVRQVIVTDIRNASEWRAALDGIETVIHTAGLAHVAGRSVEALQQANVEGTKHLMEQAGQAGVRRVVIISSAAVHGVARGVLVEDSPEQPCTAYGASKLRADQIARDLAARYQMSCIVLRPPMVYGPGMRGRPLQLFRWLSHGVPLPIGALDAPRSVLFVGNLVQGVETLLARTTAEIATFFIADSEAISISAFARSAAEALGTRARLIPVPLSVLRVLLGLTNRRRALDGGGRRVATNLIRSLVLDTSRIRVMAGFSPNTSTREGLRQTAQWFHAAQRMAG